MADRVDSDPKYRKYTQQVEKCLNSFDNVHEWADCITFLKQLLKTLQTYTQFKEIPRKLIVSKRLAQCLNPALPAGVHQRALDVYSHILAVQGSDGLSRDLALWSSGLFPFFAYAATSVKPTLLQLYDTHYFPLGTALRPITKSFILALLPGLEEEAGEFFDKVMGLLEQLSVTVSQRFFFQNMWLIMLTAPPARETCLNFLSRKLPKLDHNEDATGIIGRDVGLMIRAFSASLEDENLLVRRSALDLLVLALRLDSLTFKKAQSHDQALLMRAATSVVLRRDLTLNRRLYKWLLGPSEKNDDQVNYYRDHGLDLLVSTLKEEMLQPSQEYSDSRPFKVFVSLLDKWEIGGPLTERIICDCMHAIRRLVLKRSGSGEDIKLTANTLYEAVEPTILWKQMSSAIFLDIKQGFTPTLSLASFILETFQSHDDEIRTVHLPIVFCALLDLINAGSHGLQPTVIVEILHFLQVLLPHLPPGSLTQRAAVADTLSSLRPYSFLCAFYGITETIELKPQDHSGTSPLITALEDLVSFIDHSVNPPPEEQTRPSFEEKVVFNSLDLLNLLLNIVDNMTTLRWNPSTWLNHVLRFVDREECKFATFDKGFSLLTRLHKSERIEPRLSIDTRPTIQKLTIKLLSYLLPRTSAYHMRAVTLLWDLHSICERRHIEAIICAGLNSPEPRIRHDTFESFSVFWRLTEDQHLPGSYFFLPMMIILDTLKSSDPQTRRKGENFMRCSLKSYIRVLDPLIFELSNPTIRSTLNVAEIRGKHLPQYTYEAPFDQRYIQHLLEVFLSVVHFGGMGFARTLRTSVLGRSLYRGLVDRINAVSPSGGESTYLDAVVQILKRFLLSEPHEKHAATMQTDNLLIHSVTIDLLQAIISRGEVGLELIFDIEVAAISKLYMFVHCGRLDLQSKLLHLVHSVISATIASEINADRILEPGEDGASPSIQQLGRTTPVNPLLTQTLIDGISMEGNRPMLQHWLDFLLMAIPQFHSTLYPLISPLCECLSRQLRLGLADLQRAATGDELTDSTSTVTDAQLIMLLNAMERMILWSTASNATIEPTEDETGPVEKSADGGGLLGYVSNVFGSDSAASHPMEDHATAWTAAFRTLQEGVSALFAVWNTVTSPIPLPRTSKDDSLAYIYSRTAMRCRRVFEQLFRVHSIPVLESIIRCWRIETLRLNDPIVSAFELVDALAASAHHAVHLMCESISSRMAVGAEKRPRPINPDLSESALFQFFECYLERLEGPVAVKVWGRYLQLAKEVASSSKDARLRAFPTLRCFSVLASKVTNTTSAEDKRLRKDLQDNFSKLLDICLPFVGRSYDQGSWMRRGTKETAANGRDSPAPKADEKAEINATAASEPNKLDGAADVVLQINTFLASSVIPNLRRFLVDTDKVVSVSTNIVYYAVSPGMKEKIKPMEIEEKIIAIVLELSHLTAAIKAWRPVVTDLLYDNRFFNASCSIALKWKPIIKAYLDSDRTAFPELLSKVTTAPSANIFVNKDYEMLLRSLSLRRLSFAIFTGDKNQFLAQLPLIQEKLVDTLKNVMAPIVQSEVYLCLRVLLCRLSPHNMVGFWPTIFTELYRIFEKAKAEVPVDGSEDLQLILAASKCLDLLLTLQTEEFQIHQWIFITDTVDAIYRPDNWTSSALLDQLAEVVGSLPAHLGATVSSETPGQETHGFLTPARPMRRPMLNSLRTADSIQQLIPFFSGISIASYESVYASGGIIDWNAVEYGLVQDMFDGQ